MWWYYRFYAGVNDIFETYNTLPNFVTYLIDGTQHCFTPYDLFYTADTVSATNAGVNNDDQWLSAWTNQFPLGNHANTSTTCHGDVLANSDEQY